MNSSLISDEKKHSAAHVLAMAVTRLHPKAKLGVGPATKQGFYYDFDIERELDDKDLLEIENTANQIIQENHPFTQIILPKNEAQNLLMQRGQIYKAELLKMINDQEASFFRTGDSFMDLCRGPHVPTTGQVGIIKLQNVEKVHWREDNERPKMHRIHGLVFENIEKLNHYMKNLEETEKRNYKFIAQQKNLGQIFNKNIVLDSRGTAVIKQIKSIINNEFLNSKILKYVNSKTLTLQDTDNFFDYIFNKNNHSHKNLPISYSTRVYLQNSKIKNENINTEHLLVKTYYKNSDLTTQLGNIFEKILRILRKLHIEDYYFEILTSNLNDAYVNSISTILQKRLVSHNKIITKTPHIRILIKSKDIIEREWDIAEISLRNSENTRFVNENNKLQRSVNVGYIFNHMNILAFLLENTKGILPINLAPIQIKCIPVNKNNSEYAKDVCEYLNELGYRCETDISSKSMQKKIKKAENNNIPFILLAGQKEINTRGVLVRYEGTEIGLVKVDKLKNMLDEKMKS